MATKEVIDVLQNLRKLRKKAGFSQEEMAKLLGYKYASGYNQLETGKRKIDIETAKKISDILEHPIDEIFFEFDVVDMTTKVR